MKRLLQKPFIFLTCTMLTFILFTGICKAQDYKTTVGIKYIPGLVNGGQYLIYETSPRFALSGGVELRQRLGNGHFYLEAGLFIMTKGYNYQLELVDKYGIPSDSFITIKDFYQFYALPVSLVYKYNAFYVGVGPNINYHYLERSAVKYSQNFYKNYNTPYKIVFGGQFLIGFEKQVSQNFLLSFEGNYNLVHVAYFWLPTYGLGIGLKYIFNEKGKY
jgi:hypothetical protein